jgi:hypothetical protein
MNTFPVEGASLATFHVVAQKFSRGLNCVLDTPFYKQGFVFHQKREKSIGYHDIRFSFFAEGGG